MILASIEEALKVMKGISDSSGTLITWGSSLVGASILAMISTSYQRPKSIRMRMAYLLFLPAWVSMALSVYYGELLNRQYFSAELNKADIPAIFASINEQWSMQIVAFEWGAGFLGLWLLIYLIWWVFNKSTD